MKKFINAVMPTLTALLLVINAQAQTTPSPTPVRIELAKEGEFNAIKYSIKQGETKKFVTSLLKDKYLYVYFLDPSLENATNPLKGVISMKFNAPKPIFSRSRQRFV